MCYNNIKGKGGRIPAMDEKEAEMNNKEFETFKKMLALHLAELKELGDDKEAWQKKLDAILEVLEED